MYTIGIKRRKVVVPSNSSPTTSVFVKMDIRISHYLLSATTLDYIPFIYLFAVLVVKASELQQFQIIAVLFIDSLAIKAPEQARAIHCLQL